MVERVQCAGSYSVRARKVKSMCIVTSQFTWSVNRFRFLYFFDFSTFRSQQYDLDCLALRNRMLATQTK